MTGHSSEDTLKRLTAARDGLQAVEKRLQRNQWQMVLLALLIGLGAGFVLGASFWYYYGSTPKVIFVPREEGIRA